MHKLEVIYKESKSPSVSLRTFLNRIKSSLKHTNHLNNERIHNALYLNSQDYKAKYATRKSFAKINGEDIDLQDFFSSITTPSIKYPIFRQRIRRLQKNELLNHETIIQAALLETKEWTSFFGGGRHHEFYYTGIEYPEHHGKKFRTISSFLHTIGRYEDRSIVWSRIKRGWDIDEALTEPVLELDSRTGTIYVISNTQNPLQYVGLTITSIKQRWKQHLRAAFEKKVGTPIAQAIRNIGPENFTIIALETNIKQAHLADRERYWIAHLNTRTPHGFNIRPGGEMGSSKKKPIEYKGERFPSIEVASELLSQRMGVAKHVIQRRLSQNEEIPDKARQMSKHLEAGTNLWRRWKSLINGVKAGRRKGQVCKQWENYNQFAKDVRNGYRPNLFLVQIDESKPWCKGNVQWVTIQAVIEKKHGKQLSVMGKVYPSLNAVAREYGISRTTLKNRIEVQGLSIDEAVQKPLAPTSKKYSKKVILNGKEFSSINQAAKFAAEHYQLSFDQARDRIRRGVPLQKNKSETVLAKIKEMKPDEQDKL